jgi:hypothetical protein
MSDLSSSYTRKFFYFNITKNKHEYKFWTISFVTFLVFTFVYSESSRKNVGVWFARVKKLSKHKVPVISLKIISRKEKGTDTFNRISNTLFPSHTKKNSFSLPYYESNTLHFIYLFHTERHVSANCGHLQALLKHIIMKWMAPSITFDYHNNISNK